MKGVAPDGKFAKSVISFARKSPSTIEAHTINRPPKADQSIWALRSSISMTAMINLLMIDQ